MRRRDFITGIAGSAASWPLAARAQQGERLRRVGVLTGLAEGPEAKLRLAAFLHSLQHLGWIDGRNVRIDARVTAGDVENSRKQAAELAALAPDVIFASGGTNVGPLLQATRTVPVVFALVPDPVGSGFVNSLSRPGRNATGFMQFEYGLSGKWVELLRQIAPGTKRAAVIWDPGIVSGIGQFAIIQSVAPSLAMDVSPVDLRDTGEAERTIAAFAGEPNGGLIVTASGLMAFHRDRIVAMAARNKLPAVYNNRIFVAGGGLISYVADLIDQFRLAAGYVDRILKGEKPADLPVQAPIKYELVINLKTAKALGLTVPDTLLARADEVIE